MVQGKESQSLETRYVNDDLASVIGEIQFHTVVRLTPAAALSPRLGDRRHGDDRRCAFRAISSVLNPFRKGGLVVGAPLVGVAFDYFGSCRLIVFLFHGLVLLARRLPPV